MSKRALKKYLQELDKEQLEEQVLDLYDRFKDVKVFYNFVFAPNEDKLIEEAKFKIGKEYFPPNGRKAKARRSVAQKHIRHFMTIGVEPSRIADVMLYNIELAQAFSAERFIRQDAFYRSMLKAFEQALSFAVEHGLYKELRPRFHKILEEAEEQRWLNARGFERVLDKIE